MTLTEGVNLVLGILTVFGQIFVVVTASCLITGKGRELLAFLNQRVLLLSFIIVTIVTLGSLTYSDIIGYDPCKLCWFQRIFMYPQVILFGIALFKKDRGIIKYALTLSVIGAMIALYHYLLQLGVAPAIPCSAIGYSATCSQRFVMEFGYITIPLMALTAFLMVIVTIFAARFAEKRRDEIKP